MARLCAVLLLVLGMKIAFGGEKRPAQGPGCTTATVIDWDCDGYGPGSPLGPDADDQDPAVNTSATALAKYGGTEALLAHLGYHPQRILYIATNGRDSHGHSNDASRPYRSWNHVGLMVKPGDAIVWRAGTYPDQPVLGFSGTPAKPILLMAYPGEKVILDQRMNGIEFVGQSNIVIDGLILENTMNGLGEGAFFGDPSSNITFRNVEVRRRGRGILAMNGLKNILIEHSVFHDTTVEHCIYLGARERPNAGITVRHNIIYGGNYTGIQHNGRVTNLLVDSNIIHSNILSAVSFTEGVSDSVVSNNLMFGNGRNCMVVFDYPGDHSQHIDPWDQKNIAFVHNTCWVGTHDASGAEISQPAIHIDDGGFPVSFANLQFVNNIFVTQNYAIFHFEQDRYQRTATIRNNVMWNAAAGAYLKTGAVEADFAALDAGGALRGGNVKRDPLFKAVNTEWYKTPDDYDFTVRDGSPALGLAAASEGSQADLMGHPRGTAPDAGAYQHGPAANRSARRSKAPKIDVNALIALRVAEPCP
jgi:hypothetical protein